MAADCSRDAAAILFHGERYVHTAASGGMRAVGNSTRLVHRHGKIENSIRETNRGGERDAGITVDGEI